MAICTRSQARLTRVEDALNASRFLSITYSGAGQIDQVSDGTRTVEYGYTNGDLTSVTDVIGRITTYAYQGHLLTRATNPLGQDVAQISYDSYTAQGKATSQMLPDGRQIQFTYGISVTVMTTTARSGQQEVQEFSYDGHNTLTGIRLNGQALRTSRFDNQFNPASSTDANNHTTLSTYSKNGLLLAQTDALGHKTSLTYDSSNRLTAQTDPLGGATHITHAH